MADDRHVGSFKPDQTLSQSTKVLLDDAARMTVGAVDKATTWLSQTARDASVSVGSMTGPAVKSIINDFELCFEGDRKSDGKAHKDSTYSAADELKLLRLSQSLCRLDYIGHGRVTRDAVQADEPLDRKSQEAKDYVLKNFDTLARTPPDPERAEIVLADVAGLAKKYPDLKDAIEFAKAAYKLPRLTKEDLTLTRTNVKRMLSEAESDSADVDSKVDSAQKVLAGFDELLKKYAVPKEEGPDLYSLKKIDPKSIQNKDLRKAVEYLCDDNFGLTEDDKVSKKNVEERLEHFKKDKDKELLLETIAQLDNIVKNWDSLRSLTIPKEPVLSLDALDKEYGANDPSVEFLRGLGRHIDTNGDRFISKGELKEYLNKAEKDKITLRPQYEALKKADGKELDYLDKLIKNFDTLKDATKDSSLGISARDLENRCTELLAQVVASSVKGIKSAEKPNLTPEITKLLDQEALLLDDNFDHRNPFEKALNDQLKGSQYVSKVSVKDEADRGHGAAKVISLDLSSEKTGEITHIYRISYGTDR